MRSSHNIEDTDTRSFAGTYLSVVCHANPGEIVDAIKNICIDAYEFRVRDRSWKPATTPGTFAPESSFSLIYPDRLQEYYLVKIRQIPGQMNASVNGLSVLLRSWSQEPSPGNQKSGLPGLRLIK